MELSWCIVKKEGVDVKPEIMIPLVGIKKELVDQEQQVRAIAEDVFRQHGITVDYLVGTMIELPRAALTADRIAVEPCPGFCDKGHSEPSAPRATEARLILGMTRPAKPLPPFLRIDGR